MEKTNQRYEELAEKWLNGTITPEEQMEFDQWYHDTLPDPLNVPQDFAISETHLRVRILRRILAPVRSERSRRWMIPAAAASLLLVGSLGIIAYQKWRSVTPNPLSLVSAKKPGAPGGNKAMLTLADGRQIALEDLNAGNQLSQPGATIVKQDSGVLRYARTVRSGAGPGAGASSGTATGASSGTIASAQVGTGDRSNASGGIQYNTLSTPRGGIFQVVLPDGTHVWLNSASSLKYPTAFTGMERGVYLTGQAFFDVAPNKNQPFVVYAQKVQVKVLSTAFDLMSYEDEAVVQTTLTQGAVSLNTGKASVMLKKGQQGSLHEGSIHFDISEPDLDEVLAWKEGKFRFLNTSIKTVMRQIARWYDVRVEYQGDVSALNLTGSISRKANVSELLKAFENTGGVHFKIEEDKIIVIPN